MIHSTGDITLRLCTAAEIKFYFGSLFGQGTTDQTHYLKPNKNCNLSSWPNGCEPGWGCGANPNQKIDLYNSKDMPLRTRDCQPCCEGFFCPQGLTCMIREYSCYCCFCNVQLYMSMIFQCPFLLFLWSCKFSLPIRFLLSIRKA